MVKDTYSFLDLLQMATTSLHLFYEALRLKIYLDRTFQDLDSIEDRAE